MAENKTETKDTTKDQQQAGTEAGADGEVLFSVEEMEALINQVDPEFATTTGAIGPNEEMIGVSGDEFDLAYTVNHEIALWKFSGGWRTLVFKIFPFVPHITFNIRRFRIRTIEWLIFCKAWVTSAGPRFLKWLKLKQKTSKEEIAKSIKEFKAFPLKKKLAFVGLVILFIGFIALVQRSMTKGLLPKDKDLFIGSMKDLASESYIYETDQVELFYESTHSSQNMIALPKMVVNIRRSVNSGINPMAAFDFFIEGSASEVVVEIKDREAEIRDLFQRIMEEMTFDQLSSGEGKQLLTEKLRKDVNTILTKGKVRKIFIKTAIVKP